MRRLMATTAVAVLVAVGTLVQAETAWAGSVTVQGTSDLESGAPTDLEKMVVNNRRARCS